MLLRAIADLVCSCVRTIIKVETARSESLTRYAKDMQRLRDGEVKTLKVMQKADRRAAEVARLALLNTLGNETLAKEALREAFEQHKNGAKWF